MGGIQGFFISRTGIILSALAAFVLIPLALIKMGIENAYTDFFGNPFTAFAVIFIIGTILFFKRIRTNIIAAVFLLTLVAVGAYLYVYTLLL